MADSWKTIAQLLAGRMETHAYCPDNHQPLQPRDCPFCGDVAAYRRYQTKIAADARGAAGSEGPGSVVAQAYGDPERRPGR